MKTTTTKMNPIIDKKKSHHDGGGNNMETAIHANNSNTQISTSRSNNTNTTNDYYINPEHIVDRYGFICNMNSHGEIYELTPTTQEQLQYTNDEKMIIQRRILKWEQMIDSNWWSNQIIQSVTSTSITSRKVLQQRYSKSNTNNSSSPFLMNNKYRVLLRRVRKGIPDPIRGRVWTVLCNVPEKIKEHPGFYTNLVQRSIVQVAPAPLSPPPYGKKGDHLNNQPSSSTTPTTTCTTTSHNSTSSTTGPSNNSTEQQQIQKQQNQQYAILPPTPLHHSKSFRSIQDTIERDVHRTYPRHSMFCDEENKVSNENILDHCEDSSDSSSNGDDDDDSSTKDNLHHRNHHDQQQQLSYNNNKNDPMMMMNNNNDDDDDSEVQTHNNIEYHQEAIESIYVTTTGFCGTATSSGAAEISRMIQEQLDIRTNNNNKTPSPPTITVTTATNGNNSTDPNTTTINNNGTSTTPKGNGTLNPNDNTNTTDTASSSVPATPVTPPHSTEHPISPKLVLEGRGGQAAMRRVLKAYSTYDREIGYCQGMNFIAGMFLTLMTEEEAFWMLVVTMNEKPCRMRGLFGEGMRETHQVLYVSEKLTHQFLPKLSKHLDSELIHVTMYATQWLLTQYTSSFQFDLVMRVWDCFLVEGWKIIYRVMLSLLQHHQNELMNLSFEEILGFFRKLPMNVKGNLIVDESIRIPLRWSHIHKYENEWIEQNPLEIKMK